MFSIEMADDEALGVAVVVMMASMALSVTAGVGDTEAATSVAAVSATMVVGTGERVIDVGEAVALGRGVEVRVAVDVARGVSVGAWVGAGVWVGRSVGSGALRRRLSRQWCLRRRNTDRGLGGRLRLDGQPESSTIRR